MTAASIAPERAQVRVGADQFFMWMAWACVAIAFGGFSMEYWAPTITGRLAAPPIMHIHGISASLWTIFLATQATWIANGQTRRHRELGLLGVALATFVVMSGLLMVISGLKRNVAAGFGDDAKTFSIVSTSVIVFFAVCVGLALAYAKRRETHKRLMLLGTFFVLEAAAARVFKPFLAPPEVLSLPLTQQPPPPIPLSLLGAGVSDILVIVALVYDWRTRGKPHPVWIWGGLVMLVFEALRFPVGPSPAWHSVADWMISLAA